MKIRIEIHSNLHLNNFYINFFFHFFVAFTIFLEPIRRLNIKQLTQFNWTDQLVDNFPNESNEMAELSSNLVRIARFHLSHFPSETEIFNW